MLPRRFGTANISEISYENCSRTSEPARLKILQNGPSHAAGFLSSANQRNRLGSKNPLEREGRAGQKVLAPVNFGLRSGMHKSNPVRRRFQSMAGPAAGLGSRAQPLLEGDDH